MSLGIWPTNWTPALLPVRTFSTSNGSPLAGVLVVSLEQAIAAPLCTRHLADLGARVVKIERPGAGDFARAYDQRVAGLSSHFVWANRSKESLTLDLKESKAMAALKRLLSKADVLVQNLAPSAVDRLGLSPAQLEVEFPSLIVCGISGYGTGGPYGEKKAYDLLIQSESGFLSVTGTPEDVAKAGCSVADISAGMYAYSSILAALLQRGRTGKGCNLEISMLESMVEWMGFPMYYSINGAPPPPRSGASHATIFPYGNFPVGDDGAVLFAIQNEREWAAFTQQVLRKPELATDEKFSSNPKRHLNRDVLWQLIVDTFSALTSEEVTARLDSAQIANARVRSMSEVWSHPQLQARERWTEVDSPAGRLPALLPPWTASGFAASMGAVPAVGQHTASILEELGYSPAEVAELREQGLA